MAGTDIEVVGIDNCLRAFNQLERDLRKSANSELRQTSKRIGSQVIVPLLGGSGSPQEEKILAAAAPKSDRYIVVAVPQKKPKLSGLKKTSAPMAKRIAFGLEGGSVYPPFHKPRAGAMVHRHAPEMARRAVPRYLKALHAIMVKHGLI